MIFLGRRFMVPTGPSHRAMGDRTGEDSVQVLFGKAFLLELQRGNMKMATVFARAFLLRKASLVGRSAIRTASASRGAVQSSRRPPR